LFNNDTMLFLNIYNIQDGYNNYSNENYTIRIIGIRKTRIIKIGIRIIGIRIIEE